MRQIRKSTWIAILLIVLVLGLAACSPALGSGSVQIAPASDVLATLPNVVNSEPAEPEEALAEQEQVANTASGLTDAVAAVAGLEGVLSDIYVRVNPSVVHIRHQAGEGSGFVWDTDGHIVSNNHVVAGAQQLLVTFADDTVAEARIVGTDPDSDLAVLKVDLPADRLVPVKFADSTAAKVGQLAVAIGNPFGQDGTMTVGIISALGRHIDADNNSLYRIPDAIQTDAAINPGNSGGVLLNPQGEVIGVTSAIISPVRASSGVGFAIPSVIVERVVTSLIETGTYQHPYLGVTGMDLVPDVADSRGLPSEQRGALLVSAVPGGPAAAAGLVAGEVNGDVVVEIDGEPVNSMDDLITYLARYGTAGETVDLTVLRGEGSVVVQVELGSRPSQP